MPGFSGVTALSIGQIAITTERWPGVIQVSQVARVEITEKDITGLKYFDQLALLLERLHDDACEPDTAGNRTLHFDQYAMLMLSVVA